MGFVGTDNFCEALPADIQVEERSRMLRLNLKAALFFCRDSTLCCPYEEKCGPFLFVVTLVNTAYYDILICRIYNKI